MQGTNLVATGSTQIGNIELVTGAFTDARWVFAGDTAIGQSRDVPDVGGCEVGSGKADDAAVAVAG